LANMSGVSSNLAAAPAAGPPSVLHLSRQKVILRMLTTQGMMMADTNKVQV
jgi:hypothetical protein